MKNERKFLKHMASKDNMNAKEKWIEAVVNSLERMQKADTDPFFYTRLKQRMNSRLQDHAPAKLVWLVSASLVIVLLLNVFAWRFAGRSGSERNALKELSGQMQLVNTNSIDYN